MFDRETYHEMLCPVCGEFYFTRRNEGDEDLGYSHTIAFPFMLEKSAS